MQIQDGASSRKWGERQRRRIKSAANEMQKFQRFSQETPSIRSAKLKTKNPPRNTKRRISKWWRLSFLKSIKGWNFIHRVFQWIRKQNFLKWIFDNFLETLPILRLFVKINKPRMWSKPPRQRLNLSFPRIDSINAETSSLVLFQLNVKSTDRDMKGRGRILGKFIPNSNSSSVPPKCVFFVRFIQICFSLSFLHLFNFFFFLFLFIPTDKSPGIIFNEIFKIPSPSEYLKHPLPPPPPPPLTRNINWLNVMPCQHSPELQQLKSTPGGVNIVNVS